MKKLCLALVLLASSAFSLADDRPTEASVREFLQITKATNKALFNNKMAKLRKNLTLYINEYLEKNDYNKEQQKILDATVEKVLKIADDELSYEKMESLAVKFNMDFYTQSEINALIEFSNSKAGKSIFEKIPNMDDAATIFIKNNLTSLEKKLKDLLKESIQKIEESEPCGARCFPAPIPSYK